MDYLRYAEERLRGLDGLRCAVRTVEQALQVLTPEERMVLDRLYIHPKKGSVSELCELLEREPSSIYRKKESAIKKLAQVFGHGAGDTGEEERGELRIEN